MKKLLVVDDEIRIREVIKEYGTSYGYDVVQAEDGLQALEIIKRENFDCIILDIMMPNMDGYTTCKKIKEFKDIPVIMLSARTEEDDKLYSFNLGVDDYVSKPFSPKELMARIKAVTGRNNSVKTKENISFEGIEINDDAHEVKVDGEVVHLTNKEYELLSYLINNINSVITRETLLQKIWGYDSFSNDRTVDTHIKMLRKNIKKYGQNIVTVRGIGYKFEK